MASGVPIPSVQFSSWNNAELADPAGSRHLVSGAFAYDKLLGSGCDLSLSFNELVLRLDNNDPFIGSEVAVINVSFPNFGVLQSSGLSAVYNMKFYIPSSQRSVLDLPGIHLQFQTSGSWIPNVSFPSGAGQQFSGVLPTQFNLRRIDGAAEITSYNDQNVSEYIYMRLFLDRDFPVGTFGVCGSGTLKPRLTFDFY